MIVFEQMSDDAVAAIMNALNPGAEPFACPADQVAFGAASLEVARRFMRRESRRSARDGMEPPPAPIKIKHEEGR